MTDMHAAEKGRDLYVCFGTPGAEDSIEFTIKPVNVKTGRQLLDLTIGMAMGLVPENVIQDAFTNALGKDNADKAEETLRSEEITFLYNAALFWNAYGGSIAFVDQLIQSQDEGDAVALPKVATAFLERHGIDLAALAKLKTSQISTETSTESESDELTEPTPDTTSQPGLDENSQNENETPQSETGNVNPSSSQSPQPKSNA